MFLISLIELTLNSAMIPFFFEYRLKLFIIDKSAFKILKKKILKSISLFFKFFMFLPKI